MDTLLCFVAGGAYNGNFNVTNHNTLKYKSRIGVVSPATTRSNPGPLLPGSGGQLERARNVLIRVRVASDAKCSDDEMTPQDG